MSVRKVCKKCGSTCVLCDAFAEWDEEKQEWVIASTFENSFCEGCDGECIIVDEEIN